MTAPARPAPPSATTRRGFVVFVLTTEFESVGPVTLNLPVKIGPPLLGVLPVYATAEDAARDYPGRHIRAVEWEETK